MVTGLPEPDPGGYTWRIVANRQVYRVMIAMPPVGGQDVGNTTTIRGMQLDIQTPTRSSLRSPRGVHMEDRSGRSPEYVEMPRIGGAPRWPEGVLIGEDEDDSIGIENVGRRRSLSQSAQ